VGAVGVGSVVFSPDTVDATAQCQPERESLSANFELGQLALRLRLVQVSGNKSRIQLRE
jgi:hypothetical protein